MSRLQPLPTLLVLTAAVLLAAPPDASAAITKGPYLQNPGPTGVTVQYETDAPGEGAVRFGTGGAMDGKATATLHQTVDYREDRWSQTVPAKKAYLYRARLTGLKPATEYQYQVAPGGAGGPATVTTFRTFPDRAEAVTFIVYGDSRSYPERHRAVAINFMKHRPAFILHTGDLVRSGYYYEEWGPQFFEPLAGVAEHVAVMPAMGNHDGLPEDLVRLFDLPGGRTWYSFDCGPVHVVVLDNEISTPEVLTWLDADLAASRAPWKVAMYHYPTFDLSGYSWDPSPQGFLPVLERHGVDVIASGHSHIYERFRPLIRRAGTPHLEPVTLPSGGRVETLEPAGQPVTCLTAGGGGAFLYETNTSPLLAKAAKTYHYCVFTADAETLRMETFMPDGEKIDSMAATKKAGQYDAAYLAEARPMESAFEAVAATSVAPPLVPGVTGAATVPLVLKITRPAGAAAATVTFRLAESCSRDYDMPVTSVEVKAGEAAVLDLHPRTRFGSPALADDPRAGGYLKVRPALRLAVTVRDRNGERAVETGDVVYRKPAK